METLRRLVLAAALAAPGCAGHQPNKAPATPQTAEALRQESVIPQPLSVRLANELTSAIGRMPQPVSCAGIIRVVEETLGRFGVLRIVNMPNTPSSIAVLADGKTRFSLVGQISGVTDGVRLEVQGVLLNIMISSGNPTAGEPAGFSGVISFSCVP